MDSRSATSSAAMTLNQINEVLVHQSKTMSESARLTVVLLANAVPRFWALYSRKSDDQLVDLLASVRCSLCQQQA